MSPDPGKKKEGPNLMKKLLAPLALASLLVVGSAGTAFASGTSEAAEANGEAAIAGPDASPSPRRTRTRRRPIDLSGPHGVGRDDARENRGRPGDVGRAHGRGTGSGHGSPHGR